MNESVTTVEGNIEEDFIAMTRTMKRIENKCDIVSVTQQSECEERELFEKTENAQFEKKMKEIPFQIKNEDVPDLKVEAELAKLKIVVDRIEQEVENSSNAKKKIAKEETQDLKITVSGEQKTQELEDVIRKLKEVVGKIESRVVRV